MPDPVEQTEPKEEPKEEEVKEKIVKEPYMYKGRHPIDATQADQLIELGYDAYLKQNKVTPEEEPESEEEEDRVGRLEKKQKKLEEDLKNSKQELIASQQYNKMMYAIDTMIQKDSTLKEFPDFNDDVKADVLKEIYANPSTPLDQSFEKQVEKYKKIIDRTINDYMKKKIKDGNSTATERGSGADVLLSLDKPMTYEDIKKGAAKKELMRLARAIGSK